ncbi:uncharacterized protein [Coffea arabica]|uniref:Reverse transcriptase domain-containing protein n=1 Tax=Coffea arabica TaxID=13443 RepID=A0ABM4X5I0_COFAR
MDEEITFGSRDAVPLASGNHEPVVIDVVTSNYRVKKMYVDQGSAVDILFHRVFKELGLEDRQLTPVRTPLVGFTGPPVNPKGMITLMVTVGQAPKCRTIPVNFVVVKQQSPYNVFLGRPALNALRAIPFSLHLSVKFPTPGGIAEVFAWTVEDMPGIPTDLAVHHLNVDPCFKLVNQKKRSFTPERNEVIKKEVGKLLESRIILKIEMAEKDREKTSFITEEGTYCYRTMPFGLKNAGATYQRLVNKLFQVQIGRSMEVYVDDMIVKS